MTVINVTTDSTLTPERVLHAAYDFSDRREASSRPCPSSG